jgi:hypothetical protein
VKLTIQEELFLGQFLNRVLFQGFNPLILLEKMLESHLLLDWENLISSKHTAIFLESADSPIERGDLEFHE